MTIEIGATLPDATFGLPTAEGPGSTTTQDVFAGKTVVLFAVPGAFTPTCHKNHLPGFLKHVDSFKAKGVDTVAVTSVNDVFVMGAWAESTGALGTITFLADGSGHFAKALGLELDLDARGLGLRSKRYAMLVRDRKVEMLAIEPNPGQADETSAEAMLARM